MNSLWILMLSAILRAVSGQSTGCVQSEYFISLNETITPPERVRASSWLTGPYEALPRNALHYGDNGANNLLTWCTLTTDPNPYIVINFTEPVFISSFVTSGSTLQFSGLNIIYGSNFTLEYTERSPTRSIDFVYYENSAGNEKYFKKNGLITFFRLERGIITESIRLNIHDSVHVGGDTEGEATCLGLGLIGCTASELGEDEVITNAVIRDYQVLEIALPIALLTIIIVLVLVVIGVVLCTIRGRCGTHKYEIPISTTPMQLLSPGQTLRTLDNSALYNSSREIGNEVEYEEPGGIPIPQGSVKVMDNSALYNTPAAARSGTIKTYDNELYGDVETESHNLSQNGSSIEIIYSEANVSSPPSRRDSMEENSAYVSSEGEISTNMASPTTISTFSVQRNNSYGTMEHEPTAIGNIYEDAVH